MKIKVDHRSHERRITFAVAKRKPEKNSGLYGIQTLDLCDTGAAYQLSMRACLRGSGHGVTRLSI